MKKRVCAECSKEFSAEKVLHCNVCEKCYCERCANRLGLCECTGDLTYFD